MGAGSSSKKQGSTNSASSDSKLEKQKQKKSSKKKDQLPLPFDDMKLKITLLQAKEYIKIKQDRLFPETYKKEKELIVMINSGYRKKDRENDQASKVVQDIWKLDAYRNADWIITRLIDFYQVIYDSKGSQENLEQMMPLIETLVWSKDKFDIPAIQDAAKLFIVLFKNGNEPLLKDESRVDPKMKGYFRKIIPDQSDLDQYYNQLSLKTKIDLQIINQAGHKVGPDFPQNFINDPNFNYNTNQINNQFLGQDYFTQKQKKEFDLQQQIQQQQQQQANIAFQGVNPQFLPGNSNNQQRQP